MKKNGLIYKVGIKTVFAALVILMLAFTNEDEELRIFSIGDSTMSSYEPGEFQRVGWAQVLSGFFDNNTHIYNYGRSGRSSKSFLSEGHWKKVKKRLRKGDYVIIQFGHNDQKYKDSSRYTNPNTQYKENLREYVKECRELEAIPILVTSIARRNFNKYGVLIDTHEQYPVVMRQLASEKGVLLVDMQLYSEDLIISEGVYASKAMYYHVAPGKVEKYPEGIEDNTHLSFIGAKNMANIFIQEIKNLNEKTIMKHITAL